MKKLVIYYSYTGSNKVVADYLKDYHYDIREVVSKKPLPKSFFLGMMTGGFLAAIKHKDKLVDYNNNVKEYDEIVISSPIWNGRITPPINTVLSCTDLTDKKLTFVFSSGSGEGAKALKRITKEYPNAKVIFLKEVRKNQTELKKLDELIK